MTNNIKAVATSQYDAVIAVAQQYVDGLRAGSSEGVAQAYPPDASEGPGEDADRLEGHLRSARA